MAGRRSAAAGETFHGVTRREFLLAGGCVAAAAGIAAATPAEAWTLQDVGGGRVGEPVLDRGFASVRRVAEGVYALVSDASKGRQTLSNGGFVVGRDAALLIEGHRTVEGAAFAHEALRTVSRVPVIAAVNTHYHYDHSLGNAFFGGRGIPIWAHERAGPLMVENFAAVQNRDRTPLLEPLEQRIRRAADSEERRRAESDLAAVLRVLDTVDSTVIALPSRPIPPGTLPLSIDLGGVEVTLEGRVGHSPCDIIVRVPAVNVVFTGDLLFNGWYPVSYDGDAVAWRETLRGFAVFGPDAVFVPGHGPLCGQEGVARQAALMDHLSAYAGESYRQGLPLEQALAQYEIPPAYREYPVVSWSMCMGAAIGQFYRAFEASRSPGS